MANPQTNVKSDSLRAIMNNDKFSRVVNDAWRAPVGSTKSTQARNMFRSINRAYGNFYGNSSGVLDMYNPLDGKGGVGPSALDILQQTPPTASPLAEQPQGRNVVVHGPTPVSSGSSQAADTSLSPTITGSISLAKSLGNLAQYGISSSDAASAFSGTTPTLDIGSSSVGTPTLDSLPPPLQPSAPSGGITIKPGEAYVDPTTGVVKINKEPTPLNLTPPKPTAPEPTAPAGQTQGPQMSMEDPNVLQSILNQQTANQMADDAAAELESEQGSPLTAEQAEDIADRIESETGVRPASPKISFLDSSGQVTAASIAAGIDQYGDSYTDFLRQNLDPSELAEIETILDAYDSGESAELLAISLMQDHDTLAKVMGVPKEALKYLPQNGFLATHLLELQSSIEKEYRLNEMLWDIHNKEVAGANIEQNLQSYIRGKDQYLTQLDKLMWDTDEAIANMDTSNPHVAQRMSNFRNYLTILHGRQNQRYIDYVNSSVNQHNAELDRLMSLQSLAAKQAEQKYIKEATLTEETYNFVVESIQSRYDMLDKADEKRRMMFEKQLSLYNTAQSMFENVLGGANLTGGEGEIYTGDDSNHTISASDDLLRKDKDGNLTEFLDPMYIYNTAMQSSSINASSALSDYFNSVPRLVANRIAREGFDKLTLALADSRATLVPTDDMDENTRNLVVSMAQNNEKALMKGMFFALEDYFVTGKNAESNNEAVDEFVKILEEGRLPWHSGAVWGAVKDIFGMEKYVPWTVNDIDTLMDKANELGVPKNLAGPIIDIFLFNAAGSDPELVFNIRDKKFWEASAKDKADKLGISLSGLLDEGSREAISQAANE